MHRPACSVLVGLLLSATVTVAAAEPGDAHTRLYRGNAAEPASLDPHRSEGVPSANILRDLYEGLTSEAPDGRIIPGVASSWTISEDGLTLRFQLRPEARWSNGDPVLAEDFASAFRRSVDPQTGSNYSKVFEPIENADAIIAGDLPPEALGVVAIDAHTLQFRLAHPAPYFLGLLTHSAAYPIHRPSLEIHGNGFARAGLLVGNGAYRLAEWVVQSRIRLVRNTHYWRDDETSIDEVIYYPTENQASELKRFRAGELDWTDQIPKNQVRWIREHFPEQLHVSPYLGTYYYGLNLRRPPFQYAPELREALAMAIDRETIADKLLAAGELPAYGWLPPGIHGYEQQSLPWASWTQAQREAEARRLYAAAGYSKDRPLELELSYNTHDTHRKIAIAVSYMWRKVLGVETTMINQEWKVFLQNRRFGQQTQVFRAAWISDYNDANSFLELFQSGNELNDTGYSDLHYDALLADAAREPQPELRAELFARAEARLLQGLPIIPVYFYVSARLISPAVTGWASNPLDHHYTRHMRKEQQR